MAPRKIDVAEALALLERAVTEKGEDYTYLAELEVSA